VGENTSMESTHLEFEEPGLKLSRFCFPFSRPSILLAYHTTFPTHTLAPLSKRLTIASLSTSLVNHFWQPPAISLHLFSPNEIRAANRELLGGSGVTVTGPLTVCGYSCGGLGRAGGADQVFLLLFFHARCVGYRRLKALRRCERTTMFAEVIRYRQSRGGRRWRWGSEEYVLDRREVTVAGNCVCP
jgi:hypothetical protein